MGGENEEVVMVAGVVFEQVRAHVCVCACACACQWGPGALRELEKTAGSIWVRLIGQLGTVS